MIISKKSFIRFCYSFELSFLTKKLKKSLQNQRLTYEKEEQCSFLFVILPGERRTTSVSLHLARGLAESGFKVDFLICDGMPACELKTYLNQDISKSGFASEQIDDFCRNCIKPAVQHLTSEFSKNTYLMSDFAVGDSGKLSQRLKAEIKRSAASGAIRYNTHAKGVDNKYIEVDEPFFRSAEYSAHAFVEAIKKIGSKIVISHHGIYVPTGLLPVICEELNRDYFSWNFAYKADHILVGQGDTYHKTILKINEQDLQNSISDEQLIDAKDLLAKKISGLESWVTFYDQEKFAKDKSHFNGSQNYHLVLTNVAWDAQIFDGENLPFKSQYDWLFSIISYAQQNKDINIKIRVHPAEKNHPIKTRVTIREVLMSHFSVLGDNIEIFDQPSDPSSYDLMGDAICVHTYASKVAFEAAALENLVTVAGEGWARNKNIGIEINERKELFEILSQKQLFVSDQQKKIKNALKFFLLLNESMTMPLNLFNKNIFRKFVVSRLFLIDIKKMIFAKPDSGDAINYFRRVGKLKTR